MSIYKHFENPNFEDRVKHIKNENRKTEMLNMLYTLENLKDEEFELERKLYTNRSSQSAIRHGLKYAEEANKADERLDRDLESAKESAAKLLKTFVSEEGKEFFGDLEAGRKLREGKR